MVEVSAYLERIGYSGSKEPSADTLRALHRAHMLTVPFENLDIALGRTIICDESSFLRKIIDEHRGGFCYELNGAFAVLLRALGFSTTLLSACVARPDGSDSREFDHLALRVEVPAERPRPSEARTGDLDRPWLVDVGFGDSFIEPLCLEAGLEQRQIGRVYRLMEAGGRFSVEAMLGDDKAEWKRQYSFTLQPRQLSEFEGMCAYQQTSPESHFTRQRICSRATDRGRVTLSDLKLIETIDGRREERVLGGEDEWRVTLRELFQINLPRTP